MEPKLKIPKSPPPPPAPANPAVFVPPEKLERTVLRFDPKDYLNKGTSGLQLSSRTAPLEEIAKESRKKQKQLEGLAKKYIPESLVKGVGQKRQEILKEGRGVMDRFLKKRGEIKKVEPEVKKVEPKKEIKETSL
ncbi:MAG TPA: hypothetical protein V6C82_00490 [Chroococcales cyanobacterium]|jgi:hypothetical protein